MSERSLSPFYRYEYFDTQRNMADGFTSDKSKEIEIHTLGIHFKPIPQVVIKADWRIKTAIEGALEDEVNLGVGYAF